MSNVINLFAKKEELTEEVVIEADEVELSFEEIAKRNKENAERMKKERLRENKNVIRGYGLKKKH
jgi:hypothetical protein